MTTIGRYEILEKIGEGGFGEVFSAMDPSLQRKVAIKTCTSRTLEHLQRFEQEAALGATLSHRNITATYDFFDDGDRAFLVQEYLDGEDLDQKIARREELSFTTKLLYLIQLARGLSHAHARRVVHRDVKPSNVRILPNDQVKLMDFGIARSLDDDDHLTLAGETMGTAAYLSPEQVRGERVDQRSDIYSFGVTAYELLSFERPFPGEHTDEVLRAVVSNPPIPLESVWPDCPSSLARMVGKCLQKDREDRYNDFREILKEFDLILGQDSGQLASQDMCDATVILDSDHAAQSPQIQDDFDRTVVINRPTIPSGAGDPAPIPPHQAPRLQAKPPTPGRPVDLARQVASQGAETPPGPSLLKLIAGLAGMGVLGALAAVWFFGLEGSRGTPSHLQPPPVGRSGESTSAPLSDDLGEDAGTDANAALEPESVQSATLILMPAWTSTMTARVGTRTFDLQERQEVRLEPGNYTVVFQLQDDPLTKWDESQSERRQVRLRADQTTTLASGLRQPGAVTLRAALGAPQAFIRLDDRPLGWAPVDEHVLQPGNYQVTAASSTQGSEELTFTLTIEPGMESVITFNLETADTPRVRIKEWNP